jgi:hypothetical protein
MVSLFTPGLFPVRSDKGNYDHHICGIPFHRISQGKFE